MASNEKRGNADVKRLSTLQMLFVFLSASCIMQIVRETWRGLPGCASVDTGSYGDLPTTVQKHPVPKHIIDPLFQKEQEKIDRGMDDAQRCAQYGVGVLAEHQKHKRRIFFGSMLADENPEVIEAHAIEVFDKYDVIAFVESNTTHSGVPRAMKYGPGSMAARRLEESELFGKPNKTKVIVDYWLEDRPDLIDMTREVEQRNTIWRIWVDQGMREEDVGIMADLDEIVSRDFLNALQVCDFPKLRHDPDKRADCQKPKIILSTLQFEASPLCLKRHEWFHPDLIAGSCILGVGDPSGRTTPEREHRRRYGGRSRDWGKEDYNKYPQDVLDNERFPLWDGRDIRETNGSNENLLNFINIREKGHDETARFGTAYHLHNWFRDTEELRHKYLTYGHSFSGAKTTPLTKFGEDIGMQVRCALGLGNKGFEDNTEYYENNTLVADGGQGSTFSIGGNRPIYFQNRTYVEERHALVIEMIKADEEKYGYGRGNHE